jgi:hypothetical protein
MNIKRNEKSKYVLNFKICLLPLFSLYFGIRLKVKVILLVQTFGFCRKINSHPTSIQSDPLSNSKRSLSLTTILQDGHIYDA